MAGIVDEYPYQASYPGAGSGYFTGTCPTTAEEISSEWDSRTMANKYELKDITHHLYQTLPTQVSPPLAALRSLLLVVRSFTRTVRSPRSPPFALFPRTLFSPSSLSQIQYCKDAPLSNMCAATCKSRCQGYQPVSTAQGYWCGGRMDCNQCAEPMANCVACGKVGTRLTSDNVATYQKITAAGGAMSKTTTPAACIAAASVCDTDDDAAALKMALEGVPVTIGGVHSYSNGGSGSTSQLGSASPWSPSVDTVGESLDIDLSTPQSITGVVVQGNGAKQATKIDVSVSDGATYSQVPGHQCSRNFITAPASVRTFAACEALCDARDGCAEYSLSESESTLAGSDGPTYDGCYSSTQGTQQPQFLPAGLDAPSATVGSNTWVPSISFSFNNKGNTNYLISRSFLYTSSCEYRIRLSGWTHTRQYHNGFLRNTPGNGKAEVSGLTAGKSYAYEIGQFASRYPGVNPLTVNGVLKGSTTATTSTSPTATGSAIADSAGKITFLFTRSAHHVSLSSIKISESMSSTSAGDINPAENKRTYSSVW